MASALRSTTAVTNTYGDMAAYCSMQDKINARAHDHLRVEPRCTLRNLLV